MYKSISEKIGKYLVGEDLSVKEAMRRIDSNKEKIIFVVKDNNVLLGTVTDGDIRRWIIANGDLNSTIYSIYNNKPKFVEADYDPEKVKQFMSRTQIEWIPVVNNNMELIDVIFWNDLFGDKIKKKKKIDMPVVIMAGGLGIRLEPFTSVLPKPLIPIHGKPIIDIIIENFRQYAIKEIYISINYKSRIIKAYFEESNNNYNLHFITEHKPLGTAGCLRNLEKKVNGPIFITNCDIIIESDYYEIAKFHNSNKNDITIVGSMRNFVVPYGTCEISNGGTLECIKEKPSFDFLISTGMYVLNHEIIRLIPKNKIFHMTDLINKVKRINGKVAVFPISEKSWIDVGQWDEYHRSLKDLRDVN